ncbi:MAG: FKBP-type peptidyl-prolyl cis-trans isomerase [Bacteroidetes bacterium]|nr:FKBP-type peptidyl-prolyl cis-trans isomerase [Bacteroidota bacterium]
MKKLLVASVAVMSIMTSCGNIGTNTALKSESDSLSNAIGNLMGMQLKSSFKAGEIDTKIVSQAMQNILQNEDKKAVDSILTESNEYFRNYLTVILPARKSEISNNFISEVEKRKGVKKTESGLLYEIIETGDMKNIATNESIVTVDYKGTLNDGEVFDSSYDRGEPAEFPLGDVIEGWKEGIKLIGEGGKIKLFIPSNLAYGNQGPLAGEALEFEVELLKVKASDAI